MNFSSIQIVEKSSWKWRRGWWMALSRGQKTWKLQFWKSFQKHLGQKCLLKHFIIFSFKFVFFRIRDWRIEFQAAKTWSPLQDSVYAEKRGWKWGRRRRLASTCWNTSKDSIWKFVQKHPFQESLHQFLIIFRIIRFLFWRWNHTRNEFQIA